MEGPGAVLAAVELALLVDGVLYQVKRRPLSAFGADNAVRQGKCTKSLLFLQEQNALGCIFCKFCHIFCEFCHSPAPPLPCTFRPLIKNPPFHREMGDSFIHAVTLWPLRCLKATLKVR